MYKFALDSPHDGDSPEEGKRVLIQCLEDTLLDDGISSGSVLIGAVTNSVSTDRIVACCLRGSNEAILGTVVPLDPDYFQIGKKKVRYSDVWFFAILFNIPQTVTF